MPENPVDGRFRKFVEQVLGAQNPGAFLRDANNTLADIEGPAFNRELQYHKALANPLRLRIFKLLARQPLCTCALAKILGVSEGSITHHLKKLKAAELVLGKKESYFTVYRTRT